MCARTADNDVTLALFASCAPGLEELLAREMRELGLSVDAIDVGGVAFTGGLDAVYRANLELRTASRVIARVGEFHARAFGELERHARAQPWARFLARGRPVRFRVTCRKSRLFHTGAVTERLAGAIEEAVGTPPTVGEVRGEEEEGEGQLVIARLLHDRCTLSVDTSGALLHRRGYRLATAKAPLRETLAAALLLASGWDAASPLIDPMCGSGTIPIEGALLARRIAPGVARDFAFMEWPAFEPARWARVLGEARERERPRAPSPILASDRDAGAIEAAIANAGRAGVPDDITFETKALSAIAPPPGPGSLVTNPPYGVRVGESDRLRNLFAQLGNVARRALPGWTLAMLSADPKLERQLGLPLEELLRTTNGGIRVRAVRALIV